MADPFLAEIVMFGGNFAPRGWALCDGQLLPISQYSALFSLLGTTYGGDGRTTFALPELRGRAPMHPGNGPGLTPRRLGEKAGAETTTLTQANMPSHTHAHTLVARGTAEDQNADDPDGAVLATGPNIYRTGQAADVNMHASSIGGAIGNTGGGQAANNMQPYTTVNFIIALVGVYPSRS